jgi:nucleoside-diphosphate-sugar epimerase
MILVTGDSGCIGLNLDERLRSRDAAPVFYELPPPLAAVTECSFAWRSEATARAVFA